MSGRGPVNDRLTTYRLLQGLRGSVADPPLRQRPSGDPEWHMYDEDAVHLASFKVIKITEAERFIFG